MTARESEMMNPVGEVESLQIQVKNVDSLAGKTVALMDSHKVNADVFLARTEKLLREKYGVADFVYGHKPNSGRPAPTPVLDELGRKGDAAIVAFGD
ncbi:MAG: hypothetical protein ABIH46_08275 [Chloroflexota bacterium]